MGNIQKFVKHVRSECKKHGIKFILKRTQYVIVPYNIKVSGWFDADNKELVVAGKNTHWLATLVHEYAHLTQWLDQCKEWKESETIENIDDWLGGKDIKNPKKALAKTRDLELDNEKRSVKVIKEFNLPIDIKDYTRRANAYVQFYNYIFYTRRWCTPKNSPYRNPKIYKFMPSVFKMNYKKMSDKYRKIFEEAGL